MCCYCKGLDDATVSPLCGWSLFFPESSQLISLGLESASTCTIHTWSLGEAPRFLECNSRVLACWYACHWTTPRKLPWGFAFIKELLYLFRVLRRCWHQIFKTFIFVHYYFSFFSNIITVIGPTISHWVRERRATVVSEVTIGLFVFFLWWCHWPPFKALSFFWVRTCSPAMTHKLRVCRWTSPILLTYENPFPVPLAQNLSLVSAKSFSIQSTLLSSSWSWGKEDPHAH